MEDSIIRRKAESGVGILCGREFFVRIRLAIDQPDDETAYKERAEGE